MQQIIDEMRSEICDWLGANGSDQQYETILVDHLEGTCDWIFDKSSYIEWKSSNFPSTSAKFLWIYGRFGYGKTMLCAKIIESLINGSNCTLAYFFCSADKDNRREPLTILRSWILQIVDQNHGSMQLAQKYWRSQQKRNRLASKKDLWALFRSLVVSVPNCYFIVDGFDECTPGNNDWRSGKTDNREDFLSELKISTAHAKSRILIVSRDEIDIRSQLLPTVVGPMQQTMLEIKISNDDVHHDIELFSKSVVESKLPKKALDFRKELSARITEKCDGNFLWIRLQAMTLRPGQNKKMLLETVENMPPNLKQVFRRNMEDILNLPDRDKHRAERILRWVTFSLRSLTVLELTEALAVADDDDNCENDCDGFQLDLLPDEYDQDYVDDQILGLCSPFLELRNTNKSIELQTVHFVHFSIRQYFLSEATTIHPFCTSDISFSDQMNENNLIARTCLRFLTDNESWIYTATKIKNMPYSFNDYAVLAWNLHISPSNEKYHDLVRLMTKFFSPNNHCWDLWRDNYEHLISETDSLKNRAPGGLLYYLSLFGFPEPLQLLIENGVEDINRIGGQHHTALQAACTRGHLQVVILLTDKNANLDIQGGDFGSAINAAAALGYEKIVSHLINLGASLNLKDEDDRTSIHLASFGGHLQVAKLLLQNEAEMALADKRGCTPLQIAASHGHVEVVQLLLDRGANVTESDYNGYTPLHKAVYNNCVEVVKVLLVNGADVMMTDNDSENTSLHLAAAQGHAEVMKLLLNNGTDAAISDRNGWTPLHAAARGNHIEVVKILLNKVTDLTVRNECGWTPLFAAAFKGNVEAAELLLDKGANVDESDDDGYTILHSMIAAGETEVVKLFLNKGADVAVCTKYKWTPLHTAANMGQFEAAKLLLDYGANVSASSEEGFTPLHVAARIGHEKIVDLLIKNGADISSVDMLSETALHLACRSNSPAVVSALIKHGADPLLLDGLGRSSLDWAVIYGTCDETMLQLANNQSASASSSDLSQSIMKKNLVEWIQHLQNTKTGSYYHVGHVLLFLNDPTAAIIAFERNLVEEDNTMIQPANCNRCDPDSNIKGYRYVCVSCLDTDFCEACFEKFRDDAVFRRCQKHEFLKIPRDIWKNLGSDCVDESGKTVDMWLADLLEKYSEHE